MITELREINNMKNKHVLISILATSLFLWISTAWAHRPLWDDGEGQDMAHAIEIKDVDIPQVVYHEVKPEVPYLWLKFEAREGQEIYLELGVPVIERLKNFRPALALLGPGLPAVKVPFEIPAGLGGQVLDTNTVSEPRVFNEEFTGTDSWVLREQRLAAPRMGSYFIVIYVPSGERGKVWVSCGERESFGPLDIFRFPGWRSRARQFHELK